MNVGAATSAGAVAARFEADRVRARCLTGIAGGGDIWEAIAVAQAPRHPVRALRLVTLLGARPHSTDKAARVIIDGMLARLHDPTPPRRVTVAWLLNRRKARVRYAALVDALTPRREPWPGFPYTRAPEGVAWN